MTPTLPRDLELDLTRWQWRSLAGGIALFLIAIIGGIFNPSEYYHSYLFAYLFWLGLALGSLAIVMIQYLTGGAWGVMTRRILEASMRTLPLLALFFIPIAIGMPSLYDWAHADRVTADHVLLHRAGYLNDPMFVIRAVGYFAVWLIMAHYLDKWSRQEDERGDQTLILSRLSAPGLIIYVFSMTFASVDWAESLNTNWSSTIWGFIFVVGQGLTAMCFAIIALAAVSKREPMRQAVNTSHFHDLGKLLLMFVMLWGYMAYSQLIIVWSGNLTDEIPWYLPSFHTSWGWVGGLGLILFQFIVPFCLLLSRPLKQNPAALCAVVGILFVMRFVDLFWIIMAQSYASGFRIHWLNFALPVALGGIWMADYLWQLKKRPLLPVRAPNLERALTHAVAH